jgi:hypothetical protein
MLPPVGTVLVGASTTFVPLWLLRVTGDVWYNRLALSLDYNRPAIDSALPWYRFARNSTSFLGFHNTLVTTTFSNLPGAYRYRGIYI